MDTRRARPYINAQGRVPDYMWLNIPETVPYPQSPPVFRASARAQASRQPVAQRRFPNNWSSWSVASLFYTIGIAFTIATLIMLLMNLKDQKDPQFMEQIKKIVKQVNVSEVVKMGNESTPL